jgi:hypothetical protein
MNTNFNYNELKNSNNAAIDHVKIGGGGRIGMGKIIQFVQFVIAQV